MGSHNKTLSPHYTQNLLMFALYCLNIILILYFCRSNKKTMKAEIITIGDEILIGQIVDTNSTWISEQFNLNGIEIYQITSIHDDRQHILKAVDEAGKNADLVIITGGLGPTKDDITKHTLCGYFNTRLFFHEPTLEHIKKMFNLRGIDMNELNRGQAMLPENCTILPNKKGTAPGMWFEKNGTIFVSTPGVPFEMQYIIEHEVIPKIKANYVTEEIFHKTVLTQGIPESMLATKIADWENALPTHIKLAYLPSPMAVKLRLSAKGKNYERIKADVGNEIKKLKPLISEAIYGYDKENMAEVIGRQLSGKGKTLSVAESCTGGYIAHQITAIPGCSDYFKGAVTAYSNEIKENILGVSKSNLEKYGAVSEQVALEMADGVKKIMNTDYAIATTGVAGPDGGTTEKPVGTVWIAIAGKNKTFAKKYTFLAGQRDRNILRSTQTALQLLRRVIIEKS